MWMTDVIGRGASGQCVYLPLQANTSTDTLQSITSGDWDVTQVLAYDEDNQLM